MKFMTYQTVQTTAPYEDVPVGTIGIISGYEIDGSDEIIGYFIDTLGSEDSPSCTIGPIPDDYLEICNPVP